jgi:formylglycine-generating enzyme required for sulfatase activity
MVRLLGQAAAALDVAHGRGIAHRDVKPANLFVLGDDPRGGRATVKVLDFGVAKMVTDDTQLHAALAKTGMNLTSFTPQYGAPEQFSRSLGATGPWTDVYALALVAVEMLAGRPPLDGENFVQLAVSSSHPDQRPTPRSLGVQVSDAVEAVFRKALAVNPSERFVRAGDLWLALENVVGVGPRSAITTSHPVSNAATELAPPTQSMRASNGVNAPSPTTGSAAMATEAPSAPRKNVGAFALVGAAAVAAGAFFLLHRGGSHSDASASPSPAPSSPPATATNAAALPTASEAPAPPACPERMVKVPEGEYFQGSDAKDAQQNEKPAHHVKLGAFCMDLYEVTQAEYKACSDKGRCKRAGTEVEWPNITPADRKLYSPLCTITDPEKADHPINCVNWEMADLYCKAQDKRLPTEAEWEFATRGPDGRVYPWGDEPPTEKHLNACGPECVAWGKERKLSFEALYPNSDGYPTTAPVGQFEAGRSRFGPYDVVGNVWEWVSDWYGPYSAAEQTNPSGPEHGERKVIRGGGWNGSYRDWLRPSFRYAQDPKALSHGIGFRCVKPL